MSKKVVTLLNKYGPMLSGELARKFEHEYGASNTAARQALSRAKKPVNKICTLSFDKNQKFFYLESQYMSNRYIERLMDAIKQSSQINWVYICAFQSQNGFVAKSILPSLVSSPIKNVKGHKLHQRVIDDLLKCGIIVEYNETHWMLAEWASIQNRSIARAVGLETVKKQVVNDFASWAQNINLIGYDSAKVLSASAEFANFQWALTAPAYIQPLYDTEKIRPGFVVADIFYGRTATEEDINFFLDKLSVIRTFKKLPAFMPVFLVENITREALMILKENKVMVALIKNVFDEKYAELLAEIVSVFSHSSAIISKNPEKIETLFSEIAKAEGRYNDIIGDMFELLVGYYYQHIGYRYLEIRKLIQIPDFSKDETGVSLWLGQAKLGGKAYCKTDINKDLLEKFTAEYLSKQIFFVCEKRVSLTDDTKAILEAIEEINIRSMEDDATLRGKKLLDYFKSEGIRIKIPCLLAYGEETVYKDARALCQMIDRETDSIRDYFNAHTYAFQGFSPEIVFYVFPIESIARLRDKEAGFYAGLC